MVNGDMGDMNASRLQINQEAQNNLQPYTITAQLDVFLVIPCQNF